MNKKLIITLYTKKQCSLCFLSKRVIKVASTKVGGNIDLNEVNIESPGNERWYNLYKHDIPVGHVNGKEFFRHRVDEDTVMAFYTSWQGETSTRLKEKRCA